MPAFAVNNENIDNPIIKKPKSMKTKRTLKTKFILLFCVALFFTIHITETSGQSLFIKDNTGLQTEYIISNISNLTFDSGELIVKEIDGVTDAYLISDIRYMNFDDLTWLIENPDDYATFNVYPNPVNDILNIRANLFIASPEIYTLQIVSVEGRLMHSESMLLMNGENSLSINVSSLPKGIYICFIKNNELIETNKIIKL